MCYIVADNIDFMDYRIFNNANDLAYQTKKAQIRHLAKIKCYVYISIYSVSLLSYP